MIPLAQKPYSRGDFHRFESADRQFLYLAPDGAIFELDKIAQSALDMLEREPMAHLDLVKALESNGFDAAEADSLITELFHARVVITGPPVATPVSNPPKDFPLQSLVLNVTNQCNLACTYCYEFGADRIASSTGKPKYMDIDTAKASVDFLIAESRGRRAIHITFFGGETLLNFKLLREVVAYATAQAAAVGKYIDFSLTTNATLLTSEIIEFLSTNAIGVTVSMDGPAELQDKRRVYKNGKGSYAVIEPRLRALIAGHRTRPITARVTLTEGVTDVIRIYRHLKDDLGFAEVGFAPVTQSGDQAYALDNPGMDSVVRQFEMLADEWLEFALQGKLHGFSNVSETMSELIKGVSKSHPCGAGIGLLGVSPGGELSPCHRFTEADNHSLGHISTGIDQDKREDFLERGHVGAKYDCQTCWARPLCAGGCHHEAFVRYGDTGHANLHYCDWIRGWTDYCLKIYGALAANNPEFLEKFAERKAA